MLIGHKDLHFSEVLAELATHTQVLFFTRHQHLVSLAQAAPFAQVISVQQL